MHYDYYKTFIGHKLKIIIYLWKYNLWHYYWYFRSSRYKTYTLEIFDVKYINPIIVTINIFVLPKRDRFTSFWVLYSDKISIET